MYPLGFQDVNAESKEVSKPTSNVDSKTKQDIINKIKNTSIYKEHANSTSINSIKDENIIVHLDKGENTNVYSVSYIFGKELAQKNNNLAMIELKYNEANKEIFYDHMMYSKFVKHDNKEYINMKGVLNDKPYYEFNIDQKGHYYDKNFNITSKDKIEEESFKNLPPKERGWCEWAVGALCGTGGAGGCWAAAAALGITTGWGGFTLATICGLITSLGCTGATNYICK
ncbi:Uncharacterised protein [Staphylococcus intermedius NCTC 11048]|uniref:Uncharacterized protein n=1 Tax=Staphylococcus intermedius NCTC 11048 TaxID=1141106 RepID=A0A380FY09_STAIN|nr:Uncharacterised protein [Staphylococcus intermedius NCTC 11048]